MRIGIILTGDFEEGNGKNARIKAYAKGLSNLGDTVDILLLHASSFNYTHVNNKVKGTWEGVPFQFLNGSCARPRTRVGKIFDSCKAIIFSTIFLLRKAKAYDAFYLYSPKPIQAFHIYGLLKLLGIPLIVEMTERYSAAYEEGKIGFGSWILKKLHQLQERYLNYLCSHLIVISRYLYNYYSNYFNPGNLSLLPIMVDLSRFSHLNPNPYASKKIGYLGSFGTKDGVPGIIEAFRKARAEIPDLQLRLMGFAEGEASKNLQKLPYHNDGVEYLGQVYYKNIPDYLNACDLLIINRPDTAYAHYGFPSKLGEYLATGRPVIAANVGDVSRYLTHHEEIILTEPENPGLLATRILDRYQFYDYYSNIGLAGARKCQQNFDHQKQVKSLQQIIAKVAGYPQSQFNNSYHYPTIRANKPDSLTKRTVDEFYESVE